VAELTSGVLVLYTIFLELKDLLVVSGGDSSAVRVFRCLIRGYNGYATPEASKESDSAEASKAVRVPSNDAAGGVPSYAKESTAWFSRGAKIDMAARGGDAGMLPDLVAVAVKCLADKWVVGVEIYFAPK
jgi:hypothetical protein